MTELAVARADGITPQSIRWLMPGRIALGKTTILAGVPGLGKSQTTCGIASGVTTGGLLPDGTRAPLGDVIFITAEDDPSDTVVPRLMAAGADLSRVHILDCAREIKADGTFKERGFDLSSDVPALTALLARLPETKLVIIDPVTAYLGGTDSHRTSDVRGVLRPLERLAQARGAAVLLVSHLNKAGGAEAMTRITGSLAFVAAARAAFLIVADPDDEDRRLFLSIKSNLAEKAPGLAYRIEGVVLDNGITTSRVVWTGEAVTLTADEALAAQGVDPADRTQKDEAVKWLREALTDGPRPRQELERKARTDGVALATLKRGAKVLGVTMTRTGYGSGSIWTLPAPFGSPDPHSAHVSDMSQMGPNEPNGHVVPFGSASAGLTSARLVGGESPAISEAGEVDDVVAF